MQNKEILNQLKNHYIKIPEELFTISLPAQSVAIYCLFAHGREDFNPGVKYIGTVLRMSPTTVIKYIKILIELNIISLVQRGFKGRFSKYRFEPVSEWKINE